jgi:hypothetical protein
MRRLTLAARGGRPWRMSTEDEASRKAREAREAKLAQALRVNLRRRKAADRVQAPADPPLKDDKRS